MGGPWEATLTAVPPQVNFNKENGNQKGNQIILVNIAIWLKSLFLFILPFLNKVYISWLFGFGETKLLKNFIYIEKKSVNANSWLWKEGGH